MNEDLSQLARRLSKLGRDLRGELGEEFGKVGFRLLELIRAGKRDAVMYTITRIFMTEGREMDQDLLKVFDPLYDVETFRILALSFLSQVVKPEREQHEGTHQQNQY